MYIRHGEFPVQRVLSYVDLKRDGNGDSTEVLGYFVVTKRIRAAYLISRNLSALIQVLLAALVAIGRKRHMRSSAHGWALGCHIICLLLFNIGLPRKEDRAYQLRFLCTPFQRVPMLRWQLSLLTSTDST